jgi:WD40 repeat protein
VGKDGARLRDVATGKELRSMAGRHTLAFSPDGLLATSGEDGIKLWDIATAKELHSLPAGPGEMPESVAFSSDGLWLASGGLDTNVKLWDVASGKELCTLNSQAIVFSVAFSPDGSWLAAPGSVSPSSEHTDDTIMLWKTDDIKALLQKQGGK